MKKLQDNIHNLIDLNAPLDHLEPLLPYEGPLSPEPTHPPHARGCWCTGCFNTGVDIGIYLKNKKLSEL